MNETIDSTGEERVRLAQETRDQNPVYSGTSPEVYYERTLEKAIRGISAETTV